MISKTEKSEFGRAGDRAIVVAEHCFQDWRGQFEYSGLGDLSMSTVGEFLAEVAGGYIRGMCVRLPEEVREIDKIAIKNNFSLWVNPLPGRYELY